MSDINFCNTKEQLNHLGEVVTGKVDGSPTGADIGTSTLPYTGQVRNTLPALEELYLGEINEFIQESDQVITDKTDEFDTSIANKEAEADAAIDSYRLLNKGPYASGIALESKFEYITYNGESYFALNPPYTTTATTPDADANLFLGGYISTASISGYTKISYKASGGNSAVENMISGNPVAANVGDIVSTGNTAWLRVGLSSNIDDFKPLNEVSVYDFGAVGDYFLESGAINPSPTDDSNAIESCYNFCAPRAATMEILGEFYSEHQINFTRQGEGVQKTRHIKAVGNVWCNLQDVSDECGLYIGDDTSGGIYPVVIEGLLNVRNIGDGFGRVGIRVQHAAYCSLDVNAGGWEIAGIHNLGSIYCHYDGKNASNIMINNGVDFLTQTSQGSGGGLRFASNILHVENYNFQSTTKVVQDINGFNASGGMPLYENCLFEGVGNVYGYVSPFPSTVWLSSVREVSGQPIMSMARFTQCWFEAYNIDQPLFNLLQTRLELDLCFSAGPPASPYHFIEINDDLCQVYMESSDLWYGDEAWPNTKYVIAESPTYVGTGLWKARVDTYKSQVYGNAGRQQPLAEHLVYAVSSGREISQSYEFRWDMNYPAGSGATNNFMANAQVNLGEWVNDILGPSWRYAKISFRGENTNPGNCVIEGLRVSDSQYNFFITHTSDLGVNTLTVDTDRTTLLFPDNNAGGAWNTPNVFVTGRGNRRWAAFSPA